MPRFKILPLDQTHSSAEVVAIDPVAALHVVQRLNCHEADVLQDDSYSFSIRLDGQGVWSIYQRERTKVENEDMPQLCG